LQAESFGAISLSSDERQLAKKLPLGKDSFLFFT